MKKLLRKSLPCSYKRITGRNSLSLGIEDGRCEGSILPWEKPVQGWIQQTEEEHSWQATLGWTQSLPLSRLPLCGPMNSQLHEPVKTKWSLIIYYFWTNISYQKGPWEFTGRRTSHGFSVSQEVGGGEGWKNSVNLLMSESKKCVQKGCQSEESLRWGSWTM